MWQLDRRTNPPVDSPSRRCGDALAVTFEAPHGARPQSDLTPWWRGCLFAKDRANKLVVVQLVYGGASRPGSRESRSSGRGTKAAGMGEAVGRRTLGYKGPDSTPWDRRGEEGNLWGWLGPK
jgi:hypothetical protein